MRVEPWALTSYCLLVLLSPSSAWGQTSTLPAVRLDSFCSIVRRPGPDVASEARAEARDFLNRITLAAEIDGAHFIFDEVDDRIIATQDPIGIGDLISTLRVRVPHQSCFRARLEAQVDGTTLATACGTSRLCFNDPEIPRPPDSNSPVLLDLELDGFHLSGATPPVSFDIDADGEPDEIAWTAEGEDDAFLCLDRDSSGAIEDGRELFGWATPLQTGERAIVGYRALAELDENLDGRVDSADPGFASLCVWTDSDRNGTSEPWEIRALADTAVVALGVDYRRTGIRDRHGNLFRYVARSWVRRPDGSYRVWPTYDVIFVEP